jgi:hypothetical protein
MIDARDLSYELIALWREVALGNNNAASIAKINKVEPVYVKTARGLEAVTGIELTAQGIVLHTGESQ